MLGGSGRLNIGNIMGYNGGMNWDCKGAVIYRDPLSLKCQYEFRCFDITRSGSNRQA